MVQMPDLYDMLTIADPYYMLIHDPYYMLFMINTIRLFLIPMLFMIPILSFNSTTLNCRSIQKLQFKTAE